MANTHYQLKVRKVIPETSEAIIIEFENPADQKLQYQSGQFLTLIVKPEEKEVRRAYSLCSSPTLDQYPAVTVKRVKGGLVSNHLNDSLKAGDTLEVMEPMGMFTTNFSPSAKRHLVLIAGGSGITPMFSILKTALTVEPNSVISLIYANQDSDSVIFKEELNDLSQRYQGRLEIVHILEKASLFWNKGYKGRISTKILRKILKNLPQYSVEQTEYYLCGPSGMMQQVEKSFQELELPLDRLRKESFGVDPAEAAKKAAAIGEGLEEAKAYSVKVRYDGEEYEFEVPPEKTILETALGLDIDLPYSCQGGMCTACMGRCVAGKVELDDEDALTPKELEQGFVLTCVGHPRSEGVEIEID